MENLDADTLREQLLAEGIPQDAAELLHGNERNFVCFKCKRVVEGALKGFQLHLKRKDHIPPYICGQDGCLNDYLLRPSLYEHIRKHHMTGAQQVVAVVVVNTADHEDHFQRHATPPLAIALAEDAVVADAVVPFVPQDELVPFQLELPEEHDEVAVDLLQSAEKSVLRLRSVTYMMTSTAVEAVQKECFLLMEDTALHLKNKVLEYLLRTDCDAGNLHQLLSEFSLSDPFVKIRTKAQQMSCFQKKYGLLMPEEIFLGYTMDSRLNTLRLVLEPTQVAASFQYLSIKDILKSVMSDPYLRNLIINGNVRSEDGYVRSFCDGELYATLPDELKMCVRVVLYIDDLEIVQALSARIGVYKVGGIYFGIQNLPAELNALLSNIFVTALAYAGDVKRPEVWAPFLKDMKELENEGCEMIVDGEPFFFRALLIAQIGDSLAAHEVLGFSHSSSNVFCRCCYINRSDMWKDGTTLGAPRTMERHALDLLGTQNAVIRKATGVKGPPLIDGLRFFQPIRNSVFDIFHDLQQGVCKMEVKLALREYVCIKKYFTEQQMNSRIKFFDYGLPDKKNKPSATITAKYLADIESYNLHQTGAQMWCLTRAFGFLFGDLVPKDDKFMVLISLLNQIMMIVFSHAHCEFDLNNLEHLVPAHHSLFLEIFPGRPEPELQVEQEAEPSGVDDNEDCDDPEEINVDTESEVFVRPEECFEEYEGASLVDADLIAVERGAEAAVEPGPEATNETTGNGQNKKKKKKRPKIVRFINKHHHMLHYLFYIRLFGPLILYWCIRYEAKHYFFKLVATVCHNFKNPLKTLMEMLQMKVASDRQKSKPRLLMGKRGRQLLFVSDCDNADLLCALGLQPASKVYQVKQVTLNGIDFRPELFVTLQNPKPGVHPVFACIKAIYVPFSEDSILLVAQEWHTLGFEARLCAFHVEPLNGAPLFLIEASQISSYRVLSRWKTYDSDKVYLAPRTIS